MSESNQPITTTERQHITKPDEFTISGRNFTPILHRGVKCQTTRRNQNGRQVLPEFTDFTVSLWRGTCARAREARTVPKDAPLQRECVKSVNCGKYYRAFDRRFAIHHFTPRCKTGVKSGVKSGVAAW